MKKSLKFIIVLIIIICITIFYYISALNPNLKSKNNNNTATTTTNNLDGKDIAFNDFLLSSEKYLIKDVGFISIPANMEIQSGDYKKLHDVIVKDLAEKYNYEISENKIWFQQKGLNDLDPSSLNTYARIGIETIIGNIGDYYKLITPLSITQSELNELSDLLKTQLEQSITDMGSKIIKWYGTSIETINGKNVLKTSFLRQSNNDSYVYVELYQFPNNDRLHQLTLSYQEEDKDMWEVPFEYILRSFTITNVR